MNAHTIRELYGYHHWANSAVRTAVARLRPEQFTHELGGSFPSVRDTLAHLAGVDWLWLERWRGNSPPSLPSPLEFPDFESVERRWTEAEDGQRRFVRSVTDTSLHSTLAYINLKGEHWQYPLWQVLFHVVNHGTYHRGQVVTLLRQLGAEPATTDLLVFYDTKS